jgi:hypothetical protein
MGGDLDKLLFEGNILSRVGRLETDFKKLRSGTLRVVTLENITNDMGLQMSGEFRTGNGLEPGSGFSGVRMGSPGFSYAGGTWGLAGVNNDVLEIGLDYVTGKFYAGNGSITLDSTGEKFYNGAPLTLWLQPDGDIFAGSDLASPDTTTFSVFTNAQIYNGEAIAAGSQMIGSNSAGYANIFYDAATGQLKFRSGTTAEAYVGIDGVIYAGGGNAYLNTTGFHVANNSAGLIFDGPVGGDPSSMTQDASGNLILDFSGGIGTLFLKNNTFPYLQRLAGGSKSHGLYVVASNEDCGGMLLCGGAMSGWEGYIETYIGTSAAFSGGIHSAKWRLKSTKDNSYIFSILTSPVTSEWANSGIELMGAGPIINEFSTDVTCAGDSDTALITEHVLVAYFAAHGGGAGGGGCPARSIMGV